MSVLFNLFGSQNLASMIVIFFGLLVGYTLLSICPSAIEDCLPIHRTNRPRRLLFAALSSSFPVAANPPTSANHNTLPHGLTRMSFNCASQRGGGGNRPPRGSRYAMGCISTAIPSTRQPRFLLYINTNLRNQMLWSGLQHSGDAPHRLGTPHARPNAQWKQNSKYYIIHKQQTYLYLGLPYTENTEQSS